MWTSALFGAKNFEFYGMPTRTRGRGSIFRDFVRIYFMDGLNIIFLLFYCF